MRVLLALVLVVAPLAFAGCIGSPEPAPPAEQPTAQALPPTTTVDVNQEEAQGPAMVVFPYTGKITAGAGVAQVGYVSPTGSMDAHIFHFAVAEGAVAVVAELAWSNPVHDLDLEIGTPDCDTTMGSGMCVFANGGNPGSGDSPVRIVIADAAMLAKTGEWKMLVWAKDALNADFTATASVFYGVPPADDYTALPN